MSLLNAERAIEAYRRLLTLDEQFRGVMAQTAGARGTTLDRCEQQLEALHPQLRRAQDDLAKALLTVKQGYTDRVTVPVSVQFNGPGSVTGALQVLAHTVEGATTEEVVRRLQAAIDRG